jgi:hypothetical protein
LTAYRTGTSPTGRFDRESFIAVLSTPEALAGYRVYNDGVALQMMIFSMEAAGKNN